MSNIRLPQSDDRISILGSTGSGKTQAAVFQLYRQNIDEMPWIVLDAKREKLINGIKKAKRITYKDKLPDAPGIYILEVLPNEEEELNDFFWKVWAHENIGIFVDEGYMVGPDNKGFNACLTQGRSKNIPMIILSQRPVWLSRFVFSESTFFQVLPLTDADDRRVVNRFVPIDKFLLERDGIKSTKGSLRDYPLQKYHSFYYDVGEKCMVELEPVPSGSWLLDAIDKKLPNKRRTL